MDDSGRALSATWTGNLPPERFVELPFIGVNPREPARVTWPVLQVYANGDTARWTGAPDSESPASVTEIAATADDDGDPGDIVPTVLAGAALLVAMVALVRSRR
jgi:hypothetical protein